MLHSLTSFVQIPNMCASYYTTPGPITPHLQLPELEQLIQEVKLHSCCSLENKVTEPCNNSHVPYYPSLTQDSCNFIFRLNNNDDKARCFRQGGSFFVSTECMYRLAKWWMKIANYFISFASITLGSLTWQPLDNLPQVHWSFAYVV